MKISFKLIIFLTICISVFLLITQDNCSAARKVRIAILKFKANNTSQNYTEAVRDILEVQLFQTNAFELIERNQIDIILREQGFDKNQCTDAGCAIQIGKVLSVDMVVVGSVNLMKDYTITVKFVMMNTGKVIFADSEVAPHKDDVETSINKLAKRSAWSILDMIKEPDNINYYLRGIVPGWAQWYSGKNTNAFIFGTAFLLSGAYTGFAIYDFRKKRQEYEDLPVGGESLSENEEAYNKSEQAMKRAKYSLYTTMAIYIINWLDIIFFSRLEHISNFTNNNTSGIFLRFTVNSVFQNNTEMYTRAGISFKF